MTKRTPTRLPEGHSLSAKRKAAADGVTLTARVEDNQSRALNEDALPTRAERTLPRVCSATGGTLPGIDLSNSAALQEMDDLEYVKRLCNGFGRR